MKFFEIMRNIFGDKDTVYMTQKLESQKYKLAIEDFSIQMAINMIAGAVSKCEFKTYSKNKEIKGDEYYIWNVEPNNNQNSSEFIQEFISKLLYHNECLIVIVAGKLVIADDFTQNEYALYPNTFTNVSRGTLTFGETFSMNDVLYFKYGNKDIRALLSNLMRKTVSDNSITARPISGLVLGVLNNFPASCLSSQITCAFCFAVPLLKPRHSIF